jgi:hypothetical protein
MGYRSDVCIVMTEETLVNKYKQIKSNLEPEQQMLYPDDLYLCKNTNLYKLYYYDVKWYDGYSQVDILNSGEIQQLTYRRGEDPDDLEYTNHQILIKDNYISFDEKISWEMNEPDYYSIKEFKNYQEFKTNSLRLHCDLKTFIKLKELYISKHSEDLLKYNYVTYRSNKSYVLYYLNWDNGFDFQTIREYFCKLQDDAANINFNFAIATDNEHIIYHSAENLDDGEPIAEFNVATDFVLKIESNDISKKPLSFLFEELDSKTTINKLIKEVTE